MSWWVRVAVLLAFLGCAIGIQVIVAATVEARPGGGNTSSGRSSSPSRSSPSRSSSSSRSSSPSRSSSTPSRSSGGSYSISGGGCSDSGCNDGGGIVLALLIVFLIIFSIVAISSQSKETVWNSGAIDFSPPPRKQPVDLAPLTAVDPEFSQSVFEDFVYQLYVAAHRRRSDAAKLVAMSPYLSARVLDQLPARGNAPSQIVVGTLRIERLSKAAPDGHDRIDVFVEATHHTAKPVYAVETWTFARAYGVQSKPPVRARTFPCPNCGAPWQAVASVTASEQRTCQHCGEDIKPGRFDWCAESIQLRSEETALASLTGTVEEYGTDLPTVTASTAERKLAEITADDPEVTFEAFEQRVTLVYGRLNEAWNANDLAPARGFVTTALRDTLQYWLDEYKRQGLRNHLDGAHVEKIRLAKIVRDKHFDAITVRVFGSGCDYTTRAGKDLVGGSRTKQRRYTEYWTFIRASSRRGKVTTEPKCPNCGAPMAISDTGDCTACNAAIETGEFDWLLSKIEQDDNYAG